MVPLTDRQRRVADPQLRGSLFVTGPAGSGKTTAAVERLRRLLQAGVRADSILVLLPQRTLERPYRMALRDPALAAGAAVTVATVGGLAKRLVELFWPLVAERAGFHDPDREPAFLTQETAQYYMDRVLRPFLGDGFFESLAVDRNRIYGQVLDNLNKSAVVGFDYRTIGERLCAACDGDPMQAQVYRQAQTCATEFRRHCLRHGLLDFSLQMEVFGLLMETPPARRYLVRLHRHLIADNVEEDTPVAHDLLLSWLPDFASAVMIFDDDAGYRRFLGADPEDGRRFGEACDDTVSMEKRLPEAPPSLPAFERLLARQLRPGERGAAAGAGGERLVAGEGGVLRFAHHRYYPEMLDWVAGRVAALIEEGVPPGEIVVLAPYLSDSLRFALVDRLAHHGVPARSHRPSRALREEPATRCLLALAALAHPSWRLPVETADVTHALVEAIDGLDLVRGRVLVGALFDPAQPPADAALRPFADAPAGVHERITHTVGGRYEGLRVWIEDYRAAAADRLDHFLQRLFGELLSQPGYGFHRAHDRASAAAQLVESVRKFRWVTEQELAAAGESPDREYAAMVADGVIAAQYVHAWDQGADEPVLLAPAWTFLMSNRRVDHQFWIDVAARGWSEPLQQPLTQPYVLSRSWPEGRPWSEAEAEAAGRDRLYRLAVGLVRRCRTAIHLGLCDVNEQGAEHRGRFLRAIDAVLRSAQAA